MQEGTDRTEVCFLALTRPALLWGAPIEAVAINACVMVPLGIVLSAPTIWRSPFMFWAAIVPIHLLLQRIAAWDFHGFRTLWLWAWTTGIGRTELAAIPRLPARSSKDYPSSV